MQESSTGQPGGWATALKLLFAALVWITTERLLANYGARYLPVSLASVLTLQTYLGLVQVVSALFGLTVLALLFGGRMRAAIGISAASPRALLTTFIATPLIFVLVSYAAIGIALPTLLDELARGGRAAAQSNAGRFGAQLVTAPAWRTLLTFAVLAPVVEELAFRGALWSGLQAAVDAVRERREAASSGLPSAVLTRSAPERALRWLGRWLASGGIATLLSTAVFGALHADMAGGLGIVRVASATGLGFACAEARRISGGLAAPIFLHVVFNTLSLSTTRRWVVTETFPMKIGVPTLLSTVAAVCAVVLVVLAVMRRQRRAATRPSEVP